MEGSQEPLLICQTSALERGFVAEVLAFIALLDTIIPRIQNEAFINSKREPSGCLLLVY